MECNIPSISPGRFHADITRLSASDKTGLLFSSSVHTKCPGQRFLACVNVFCLGDIVWPRLRGLKNWTHTAMQM